MHSSQQQYARNNITLRCKIVCFICVSSGTLPPPPPPPPHALHAIRTHFNLALAAIDYFDPKKRKVM